MDLRRLRAGEWVAAFSGVMLIAALFVPWYGFETDTPTFAPVHLGDQTGWESFTVVDLLLGAAGLVGIALLVVTATQKTVALPIALASMTALVGLVATVVVALTLLSEPGPPASTPSALKQLVDTSRDAGTWIALAGALGIALGGWLAMADERLSPRGRSTDATGRPVPPPPEIEPTPAPRP